MLSAMKRKKEDGSPAAKWLPVILAFCTAGYGVYAFIKRQFADYLFLRTHFVFLDDSEPIIFFFLDHLAIMGSFVLLGHYLAKLIKHCGERRKT